MATYDGNPVTVAAVNTTTNPTLIGDGNNGASITRTYTISGIDYGDGNPSSFTFELTATADGGVTAPQNSGRNGFGVGLGTDNGNTGAQLHIGETMTLSFGAIDTGNVGYTVASQLFTSVTITAFSATETATVNGVSFTSATTSNNYTLPTPFPTVSVAKTGETEVPAPTGGLTFTGVTYEFNIIPEPSTALLSAIGLLALLRRKR